MRKIIVTLCLAIVSSSVFAKVFFYEKVLTAGKNVEFIKIIYTGPIAKNPILELIGIINKINMNYPQAKGIAIYINSSGGDMDSGYLGYQEIFLSNIPVTTVNISQVESAATLLFCAAKSRYARANSTFMFHTAGIMLQQTGYTKPDEIKRMNDDLLTYNNIFKSIYIHTKCINLTDTEMNNLLYSEYYRLRFDSNAAYKKGVLTSNKTFKQPPFEQLYIISATFEE